MVRETQVPSSDMIKIRCIGHVTADNMKFVSKRKGNVFIIIIAFNTVFKRFYIIINFEINYITFGALLKPNKIEANKMLAIN